MFYVQLSTFIVRDSSSEKTGRIEFYNQSADFFNQMYIIHARESKIIIEGGTFKNNSAGPVIDSEGCNIIIADGVFETAPATYGPSSGIRLMREYEDSPTPSLIIYNATFRTAGEAIYLNQESVKGYKDDGQNIYNDKPFAAIMDGEFYTDSEIGLSYISNDIGEVRVFGGLVPVKKSKDGDWKADYDVVINNIETHGESEYYRCKTPNWLVFDQMTAHDRFDESVMRNLLLVSYNNKTGFYTQHSEEIDGILSVPTVCKVGARDLDPIGLRINNSQTGDIAKAELYSTDTLETPFGENWKNSPWTLLASVTSPSGDYTYTIERPMEKTVRYYWLHVTYKDGLERDDYLTLSFAEPKYMMSGTAFPTMGNVRYGSTVFCGLKDLPSYIPVDSLKFEWIAGGKVVGTERTFKISEYWMIGYDLTVRVTSSAADGSIVSAPVKILRTANYDEPYTPNVSITMNGDRLERVTLEDTLNTHEYLISKKKQNELTEDDWERAFQREKDTFERTVVFTRQKLYEQFDIAVNQDDVLLVKPGDTLYVYTRYAGTNTTTPGFVVKSVAFKVGESVSLSSITFPTAVYGCILIPYNGVEETVDIPYAFDPVNATTGSDIKWRTYSPLTVVYPGAPQQVAAADGKVTVKVTGTGTETLTAYYTGYGEYEYGRV